MCPRALCAHTRARNEFNSLPHYLYLLLLSFKKKKYKKKENKNKNKTENPSSFAAHRNKLLKSSEETKIISKKNGGKRGAPTP